MTLSAPRIVHQSLGAQILQLQGTTSPLLYLSRLAPAPGKPARGGVPVLFPQFNDRGEQPKHGWARDRPWQLLEDRQQPQQHSLAWQLVVGQGSQPGWPHAATLQLRARLEPGSLRLELQVRNTGSDSFAWTGGLHPYFHTRDLEQAQLLGLQGAALADRYAPERRIETAESLRWHGQPCERLYDTASALRLRDAGRDIELSMSGFDQWMVWNPGVEGARALPDLPDSDWRNFVCVEPVLVDRPSRLAPGEMFSGTLVLSY